MDETRVESNASVVGSEFVDFLNTLITSRVTTRIEKAGLLRDDNFSNVMTDLIGALKADDGRSGWQFARMSMKCSPGRDSRRRPKRKRGRPRKGLQ